MQQIPPPTRLEAIIAYTLSAVVTLLWIGTVVPGGTIEGVSNHTDAATPLHRDAALLVPGLLLLIALPVGFTLSRRRAGLAGVLATTDAFVALYAAVALWRVALPSDLAGRILIGVLFLLGALSLIEARRCIREARGERRGRPLPGWLRGARLAVCLMVLILPPRFLMESHVERATWLGPFLFLALSAAGAQLARSGRGLRRTGALLQLVIALHLLIALRMTLMEKEPVIEQLGYFGRATFGTAMAAAGLALLQLLVLMRRRPTEMPTTG